MDKHQQRLLVLVALAGSVLLPAGCGITQEKSVSVPLVPAFSSQTSTETPSPTPYLTPTPEVPLLPPGTYEAVNRPAGTATRIARLTQVPTWPPGAPREYPTLPPETPSYPFPTRVAGAGIIRESGNTDLPSALGRFWNRWITEASGQVVKVYAGSKTDPSSHDQGILVIVVEDANRNILSGPDTYETAQRVGPVRIVDAIGLILTLRAEDGTLFYFDVPTRSWVSAPQLSPTVAVPTIIPTVSP